jgi:hypothetical protein|tara:strand:- start:32 stop:214 length:183 start_codon:yes stop_codon:yes gene_type:complete
MPKSLVEQMEEVMSKLSKANEVSNKKDILKYVKELNELWEGSSLDMLQNASKDGFKMKNK